MIKDLHCKHYYMVLSEDEYKNVTDAIKHSTLSDESFRSRKNADGTTTLY